MQFIDVYFESTLTLADFFLEWKEWKNAGMPSLPENFKDYTKQIIETSSKEISNYKIVGFTNNEISRLLEKL